ncbi:hypothetical protein RDABS01_026002 [Bienertia sinuspersici]
MLAGLNYFQKASGLLANNSKSEVFVAHMSREYVDRICEKTGLKKGDWPFRYLGVSICNKKINNQDCEQLIYIMTMRIRGWQTRHISFAGRLQLGNSILMSICTYFMQILILPTSVVREINRICRRFLWEVHLHGSKPGYMGWNKICIPKSKGSLGIRDLNLWNNLVVGKLVWQIAENKESLCFKWVDNVYIR